MSRMSLSTALIAMTSSQQNHSISQEVIEACVKYSATNGFLNESWSHLQDKYEFLWNEQKQSMLLGAYFIGNVFLLIPSGRLTEIFGGKIVATVGGIGSVTMNFIAPLAARKSLWFFFVIRILMGAFGATFLPSFYNIMSRWVPDNFKSSTIAIISVGGTLGTITITLLSGFLFRFGFDGGWPTIFYLSGLVTFIWLMLWVLVVTTHPTDHPFINQQEVQYIISKIKYRRPRCQYPPPKAPWARIICSKPVFATIYVKLAHAWFFNVFSLKITSYISTVLLKSVEEV